VLTLRYRAPRADLAQRLYLRFVKKTQVPMAVGETPAAFAQRARSESRLDATIVDEVTAAYLVARYGAPDSKALNVLRQQVNRL
jgi:ABC-type amino acid transport substrate-binding protein